MTKLSEAQRRVLEAMRDGAELRWLVGLVDGRIYLRGGLKRLTTIRRNTLYSLESKGHIVCVSNNNWEAFYRITQAGRAALQQSGVGDVETQG